MAPSNRKRTRRRSRRQFYRLALAGAVSACAGPGTWAEDEQPRRLRLGAIGLFGRHVKFQQPQQWVALHKQWGFRAADCPVPISSPAEVVRDYALEPMPYTYPHSADSYLRMVRAIDRTAFGVQFDPVNIINSPGKYYNTTLVEEKLHEDADVSTFVRPLGRSFKLGAAADHIASPSRGFFPRSITHRWHRRGGQGVE